MAVRVRPVTPLLGLLGLAAGAPSTLDREAAALWAKARAGAPIGEWADVPNLGIVTLVSDEAPEFDLRTPEDFAQRLRRRAATGGACKPVRVLAWPELTEGLDADAEEWPDAARLRGFALYDLGCPDPDVLSAAVLTRYEGGPWRIVDLATRETVTLWTEGVNEELQDQKARRERAAAKADEAARRTDGGGGPAAPSVDIAARAEPSGGIGGVVGGVLGATRNEDGGSATSPRTVHWSEVQAKSRVTPASVGVSGDCEVTLTIDTAGKTTKVEPTNCPEVFRASVHTAAMKSTWYPMKVNGVAVSARFKLKYKFVVSGVTGASAPPSPAALGVVGLGDPIVLGALEKDAIDQVLEPELAFFRDCYRTELAVSPALAGKVTVKFVIAKDGTVSSSTLKATTVGNPTLDACVVDRVAQLRFPEPRGGGLVIVSYPVVFAPS